MLLPTIVMTDIGGEYPLLKPIFSHLCVLVDQPLLLEAHRRYMCANFQISDSMLHYI